MSKEYIKVTYRAIAKMLCSALPLEGQEWGAKVNEYLEVIKAMPTNHKLALKSAYIFSRKVPKEEREDMLQELVIGILESKTEDEKLAYAIARRDWQNWWQKYMTRQHFFGGSLNATVTDEDGNEVQLAELIVGEAEFENRMDGKLDAERIFSKLPKLIKPIINKRLAGYPLTAAERQSLSRFTRKDGAKLLALA